MTKKAQLAVVTALALCLMASGCTPKSTTTQQPMAGPSPTGFSVPAGQPAFPPVHGRGQDPHDPDFYQAAAPPTSLHGAVVYEVRAQMYTHLMSPIGGLSTAFIDAFATDPKALGGVGGGHPGVFPYIHEAVRLPFQFPIFIQPGLTVSVTATFHAFGDSQDVLQCWVMRDGLELRGTREEDFSLANHQLLTVNCAANIGT